MPDQKDEPFAPNVKLPCPVIGIGASAGGLEAVNDTLANIDDANRFAVVIVQHLDPTHTSMMAELMDRRTDFVVRRIEGGEELKPGHAYVIPPGKSLEIRDAVLSLESFTEPRGVRRPIDDFFISLAQDQGFNAACVVLSGTGADGAAGLRAIKERGGVAVAQKPSTAKFDGMPTSAIATGLVDFILPPKEVFERLAMYFDSHREIAVHGKPVSFLSELIDPICSALKSASGHDFSGYKRTTLSRRILRRMQVLEISEPSDYLTRLSADRRECEALLRDITINVTSFFRDADAWGKVVEKALPQIVANAGDSDTIRAWVPGCSSGEEAYTLAMLLADEIARQEREIAVQIFATDIDDQMLAQAREAGYSLAMLKNLPDRLQQTYTYASNGVFEIMPHIRAMVQFSSHSLIKDPPFSKLDLISCRNLLIYLDDNIQSVLIPLFHYSIKPGGFLFLGNSETIGRHDNLFETVDQRSRLFKRREGKAMYPLHFPLTQSSRGRPISSSLPAKDPSVVTRRNPAEDRLLEAYMPPHILVDAHGEVLKTSGKMNKFLDFPPGAPSSELMVLARRELREVLVPLLKKSRDLGRRQVARDIEISSDFGKQKVDVVVDPLLDHTTLILLLEVEAFRAELAPDIVERLEPGDRIHELEEELRTLRFRLRSTVEELETANEELKSSNEEMMSMNEELQSSNEELSTVNEELKTKADQLSLVNTDMQHFIESTELALVVLDKESRVRTYTDAIRDVFPLKPQDRGRRLEEVASLVDDRNIIADAKKVIAGGAPAQRLVVSDDGQQSFSMQILPYMRDPQTVDGVTLTFADVSQLQNTESELQGQTERLRLAISVAELGLWDYNLSTDEVHIDNKTRILFGLAPDQEGSIDNIMQAIHRDDRSRVEAALEHAFETNGMYSEQFRVVHRNGEVRYVKGVGKLADQDLSHKRMYGVNFDVTAQVQAVNNRDVLIREMNHRVKNLFAVVAAMVNLAGKRFDNMPEFSEYVGTQIRSLARAHDVSYQIGERSTEVLMKDLFTKLLTPFIGETKLTLRGGETKIGVDALTPLSLIIHEWATNAIKYGCLADGKGELLITWSQFPGPERELIIEWVEDGNTKVVEPDEAKLGFGTKLVKSSVSQLSGEVKTLWEDRSVTHTLTLPLSVLKD